MTSQGPPIPKIKISKGKIVLSPSLVIPPDNTTVQEPSVAHDTASDTICLDSDEEETITPTVRPTSKARKLVAVKSTAKQQQPVPVQLTAANPVNLGQTQIIPELIPTLQAGVVNLGTSQNIGQNFHLIPLSQANKLTKLPQGVVPSKVKNISRIIVGSQNTAVPMQIPNNVNSLNSKSVIMNQVPQTINLVNQMPQNVNLVNQNLNVIPQTSSFTLQPQNINLTMPENVNIVGSSVIAAPRIINSTIGTISLGSMATTGTSTKNVSSSESVLPTPSPKTSKSKPTPASSKITNKTVCKPGDILRITETGQVEILNRDNNDAAVSQPKATTSPKQTKDPQTTVSLSDDDEPLLSSKSNKIKNKTMKTKRSRKISSSSSSSSNSSRPPSPDDPLSILKDVVHIQASEDPVAVEKAPSKSKSRPEKDHPSTTSIKKLVSSKATRSQNDPVPKVSQAKKDKVLAQISKTNSVLMKLNDVFGPTHEGKGKKQNIGKIDSVDLTDATPSTSSVLDKLNKDLNIGKTSSNTPTKIVGTSKNIILTGSGKATVASTDNQ